MIGEIISSTIITLIVVVEIFRYIGKFRYFLRKLTDKSDKRMIDYLD